MKFFFIIFIFSLFLFLISWFLSKKMIFNKEKASTFECGFDPYSFTRSPFSLRFFKISIIFLIFDIEIILILPIPISIFTSNLFFFSSIFILLIIIMGLYFEWNEGSLNWIN